MKLIVNNKKILLHGFSSYLPTKRKSYTNKYAIVVEFFADKTLTDYEKEKVSCAIEKLLTRADEIKAEAIKEFAKRLKNSIYINTDLLTYQCEDVESVIDDIVKEMVGETNDT